MHKVSFQPHGLSVMIDEGRTIDDAARMAGIGISRICGGDGLCGKCRVIVKSGRVKSTATALLEREEIREGYVLACQTTVHDDIVIEIPPESLVGGRPLTGEEVVGLEEPERSGAGRYAPLPLIRKMFLKLSPPSLADGVGDLERVYRQISREDRVSQADPGRASPADPGVPAAANMQTGLYNLRRLARLLRDSEWRITVTIGHRGHTEEVVAFETGDTSARNFGIAVDVGTTTIVAQLVDLATATILGAQASHNSQIQFGADVISRILHSSEKEGLPELQRSVVSDINNLIAALVERHGVDLADVTCCVAAGNTTMMHLMLGLEPAFIRCEPYIPTANQLPTIRASEVGITINGRGLLQCMPGVGAYVGSDVVADVLVSGMHLDDGLSLLIDIGTNGEVVLGNRDFMICCSASAGPSFEGGGMRCGLRAMDGAIERVSITPWGGVDYQTIGDSRPRGICGSGMIDLVAELYRSGYLDKAGRFRIDCGLERLARTDEGVEFILAPASETATGNDITVSETDIAVFIRSKGAIYTAAETLVNHLGTSLREVDRIYIAGSFGSHLDIENSITIGLLPDLPLERFVFLGNGSLSGARMALLSREAFVASAEIADRTTYFDLSTDPAFMNRFTSSLFIPHTDAEAFPSVVLTQEVRCLTSLR